MNSDRIQPVLQISLIPRTGCWILALETVIMREPVVSPEESLSLKNLNPTTEYECPLLTQQT